MIVSRAMPAPARGNAKWDRHAPTSLPHFPAATTLTEQVRQIVQCGGTMYAVGSFTTIKKGSTIYTRSNIFSFSATAPCFVVMPRPAHHQG